MPPLAYPRPLRAARLWAMLLFGLSLAAGCAPAHVLHIPVETRSPLSEGASVAVHSQEGDVTLKEGRRGEVSVTGEVVVRGSAEWIRQVEASLRDGPPLTLGYGRILIGPLELPEKGRGAGSARVRYEVLVPPGSTVGVVGMGGSITAEGLSGPLELSLREGEIGLRDVGGQVGISLGRGSLSAVGVGRLDLQAEDALVFIRDLREGGDLTLGAGALSLVNVRGDLDAFLGAGSARIESQVGPGTALRLWAESAAVDAFLPEEGAFDLVAESDAGRVQAHHPGVAELTAAARLEVPVGRGERGRIEIYSTTGDIGIYGLSPIPELTALRPASYGRPGALRPASRSFTP